MQEKQNIEEAMSVVDGDWMDRYVRFLSTRQEPQDLIEVHHILPRCLGGTDESENLIPLTLREHYVAHLMLVKAYPNSIGLKAALALMSEHRANCTSRLFASFRKSRYENQAFSREEVIERFEAKHGKGRYDYSKIAYVSAASILEIGCPKHGTFFQNAQSHWDGCGCPKCRSDLMSRLLRFTKEEFLFKSREVHGDRYDYSLIDFEQERFGGDTKLPIVCETHGLFHQRLDNHLLGQGCPECGKLKFAAAQRPSTQDFIKKAKQAWGDKYDYSKVEYGKNNKEKVIVVCPIHGEFSVRPLDHTVNHQGCPHCGNLQKGQSVKVGFAEWLERMSVNQPSVAVPTAEPPDFHFTKGDIEVECPKHGKWTNSPQQIVEKGCPKCGMERLKGISHTRKTTEQFLAEFTAIWGDTYGTSKVDYKNTDTPVMLFCKEHGEFRKTPYALLKRGEGCPKCGRRGGGKKMSERNLAYVETNQKS
jgi:ssDNA-binding Zn-finger/Zn-ribbon topoisomerase 1